MAMQHDDNRRLWKPDARATAILSRAIDLIFPPHTLDGGASPQSPGLSPDAWSKVRFIAEPMCDGCGQHTPMITNQNAGALVAISFTSGRDGMFNGSRL